MLCYALAKNGLSFALGTGASEDDGVEVDPALDTWARTTQLIMLNEKADLVGGLMDFDVIISSCAYDGITIYATPRAAFSLKSVVQVVTPFVFEARGNRRRTTKGLVLNSTFIIDPFCFHEEQCFKDKKTNLDGTEDIKIVDWKVLN
jgi:hypothetical protein